MLAAPVGLAGGVLGTINAVTHQPRAWTDDDAGAITTLAAMTGRLLGSTNETRHRGDMEREGLSAQAAFERLRRRARARARRIDDVAREVIADRAPPQR